MKIFFLEQRRQLKLLQHYTWEALSLIPGTTQLGIALKALNTEKCDPPMDPEYHYSGFNGL